MVAAERTMTRTALTARGGRRKVGRLALVVVLLVTVVLAGCGVSTPAAPAGNVMVRSVRPLRVGMVVGWGASWSLNPFSPGFLPQLNGFSLLPLATDLPPTFGRYLPELASSWQTTSTMVIIHLRSGATWQDGLPVTASDVVTALELEGTQTQDTEDEVWSTITGLRAPDAHTVVVTVRAGQSTSLVLDKVLGVEPVPASQYGRFLTKALPGQLEAYWSRPGSKQGKAAAVAVTAVRKQVENAAPRRFVGDGPYQFTKATNDEVLLTKWSGFWDASAIHVPFLDFVAPPTSSGTEPMMPTSAWADLVTAQVSYLAVVRWREGADPHVAAADTFDLSVLAFDQHDYPVNLLPVRRALADIINRHTIMALANGGGSPDRAVAYPTGLPPAVQSQWLSPKGLEAYTRDSNAAAGQLRSAGFRQRGGKWYQPDGKRLTITIGASTVATLTPTGEVANALQAMLDAFGIRALKANGIGDLDWGMSGNDGLDPLVALANLLGPKPLFTTSYRSLPADSRPTTADVTGLGTVAVAHTLGTEAASVDAGPAMRRLVGEWARYVNRELPYLSLAEIYEQILYCSARYTDWPSPSSSLWNLVGLDGNDGLVAVLEHGYIRPK